VCSVEALDNTMGACTNGWQVSEEISENEGPLS
jgi:hypothetical protein